MEADRSTRYLPIRHLYSSTAPMSKKVTARKLLDGELPLPPPPEGQKLDLDLDLARKRKPGKPLLTYRRCPKKPRLISFYAALEAPRNRSRNRTRNRRLLKLERLGLGIQSEPPPQSPSLSPAQTPTASHRQLRVRNHVSNTNTPTAARRQLRVRNHGSSISAAKEESTPAGARTPTAVRRQLRGRNHGSDSTNIAKEEFTPAAKANKWVEVEIQGVDPQTFVGLSCKVYWPMDVDWYRGSVTGYDPGTQQHRVTYEDGDIEHIILKNEKIKFHISADKMQSLHLNLSNLSTDKKVPDGNEMLALAVSFGDCQNLEPGDLVWAKVTGHAMWPAVIVNEENVGTTRRWKPIRQDQSILVQFFGTHDFARINLKQAIPFFNGLLSSLHLKCKKPIFCQSLEEAKTYLSYQDLPISMLWLQKGIGSDDCRGAFGYPEQDIESCKEFSGDGVMENFAGHSKTCPIEIGDLRVTNLGQIVCDSEHFHNKQDIWPEGYTAFRKFTSIKDPKSFTSYKMEVLRDPKSKARPLFRVTSDDGDQIDGPNPTACWKEVYNRIRKKYSNGFHDNKDERDFPKCGSYMFGFSNPKIVELIQDLSYSVSRSKYSEGCWELPVGYIPVHVDRKDLDRCSVCHMDEEYEGNLFLQCDKCRMMVHARCYGELEPLDGVLWYCNLCRPGSPRTPPPCCLCPVVGGAIKPTTDGRWAHLTCAIWIPETCLLDVKKMEPIDGLSRINKDRWKLLCSLCGVSYGACIQCSNSTCRVAYHPLCARAADLCIEPEDEDRIHPMSIEEDDGQSIRLLSFCKKHKQPSNELPPDDSFMLPVQHGSNYAPPPNLSGCARCEPYNVLGRRGQREPQVLGAASAKRLYVENRPYLVSGYRQNGVICDSIDNGHLQANGVSCAPDLRTQNGTSRSIYSMAEKYNNMKATFRKRLAFGKSRIHGFGVFAKLAHKAGDMVIEYTGELVRQRIADIREHCIYNSLVGAGTYMFRIDDERVIDATRAGSIAHLINHSCEPNCYSRVISVDGNDRIIIFAKRDISKWEELAYDYRFNSTGEQLACYCGFPKCRRVVNDIEAEDQTSRFWVPRGDLKPLNGNTS